MMSMCTVSHTGFVLDQKGAIVFQNISEIYFWCSSKPSLNSWKIDSLGFCADLIKNISLWGTGVIFITSPVIGNFTITRVISLPPILAGLVLDRPPSPPPTFNFVHASNCYLRIPNMVEKFQKLRHDFQLPSFYGFRNGISDMFKCSSLAMTFSNFAISNPIQYQNWFENDFFSTV